MNMGCVGTGGEIGNLTVATKERESTMATELSKKISAGFALLSCIGVAAAHDPKPADEAGKMTVEKDHYAAWDDDELDSLLYSFHEAFKKVDHDDFNGHTAKHKQKHKVKVEFVFKAGEEYADHAVHCIDENKSTIVFQGQRKVSLSAFLTSVGFAAAAVEGSPDDCI